MLAKAQRRKVALVILLLALGAASTASLCACGGEDLVVGGNLVTPPIPTATPTADNE